MGHVGNIKPGVGNEVRHVHKVLLLFSYGLYKPCNFDLPLKMSAQPNYSIIPFGVNP